MNYYAIKAIYLHEMDRLWRTLFQSILSPVVSTSLYFIVFGSVIGGMVPQVDGVSYGSFIVPGLLMLTLLTQSLSNSSFGIYMPKFAGSIYEILAAPISSFEIVIGFVGASATKSLIVGTIILITATFFAEVRIGVIDNGEMIVVDEKDALISKMGQKKLIIQLHEKVANLPEELANYELELATDGLSLSYSYDAKSSQTGITNLLQKIKDSGMKLSDLKTEQGTLEDIFVSLVNKEKK